MDYLLYGGIGLAVIIIVLIIIKSSKKHTQSGFAITEIGESDPDKNYYVLSDISFHDGVRNATISHLIINPTGLHVVSEFTYEGEIEGSEDADLWTYEHKGVTDSFKNPIQVSNYL